METEAQREQQCVTSYNGLLSDTLALYLGSSLPIRPLFIASNLPSPKAVITYKWWYSLYFFRVTGRILKVMEKALLCPAPTLSKPAIYHCLRPPASKNTGFHISLILSWTQLNSTVLYSPGYILRLLRSWWWKAELKGGNREHYWCAEIMSEGS